MTGAPRTLGPEPLPGGLVTPRQPDAPHLWLVPVTAYAGALGADGLDVLDEGERKRHAAFVRQADRDRYAAAHTALRRLLGAYLGQEPAAVLLGREPCPGCGGPHGRPVAVDGEGLCFSLSHSGDLVLLAFAPAPVGADVELLPAPTAVDDVATALHPWERAELAALPAAERRAAFARCWVRKEAYLKGTGHGLAAGVDGTYTGTGPTPAQVPGWTLSDVPVRPGYAAAVAVAGAVDGPVTRARGG